jgi:hypothetical protein
MSGGKACGKSSGKSSGNQAAQYAGKQPDEGSVVTRRDTAAPENEEHASGHKHRKSMRLKEMSAAKEAGGQGETEKGKQLSTDAFAAALGAVPAEDWCRTWAACRTIMLRRTSKKVREVVDKMRLPAVVRLSRSFWNNARKGTGVAKLELFWRQLAAMTARCLITTLELPKCKSTGPDAEMLAGVLAQCPALAHLNLYYNQIGPAGVERLARVLGQCPALAHLNLSGNQIGHAGAESLAGVLGQCRALAHLDLGRNQIGPAGAERLARVLAQCPALAHLDLGLNWIGPAGAESLAGVLPQCAALAHLNLDANDIGTVGEDRLRASWRGQASGLRL